MCWAKGSGSIVALIKATTHLLEGLVSEQLLARQRYSSRERTKTLEHMQKLTTQAAEESARADYSKHSHRPQNLSQNTEEFDYCV